MFTYEKIRDLERAERDNKKLQSVPENIVIEINEYLKKKESVVEKTSSDISELENVKRVIERLFELRESKIMELSIYTVRTGMLPQNLNKEEEKMFYRVVDIVKEYREMFFTNINKPLGEKTVEVTKEEEPIKIEKKITYRVKQTLPQFIGPDMKTYELKENDVVELPEPLNEFLIKKGAIEKILT